MQLFDFAFSEDGMNLFINRVEGNDWTRTDGKHIRSDEVIQGVQSDPD